MQKLSKVTNFRDITSDPISPEEESLRHPAELMVFRFSVLLNFLLLAAAILLLIYGPEWTENYPMLYNRPYGPDLRDLPAIYPSLLCSRKFG